MKFIINPLTNEKTLLKSPEGKQILLEYVKCFQEGGMKNKSVRPRKIWTKEKVNPSIYQYNVIDSYLRILQNKVKLQERNLRTRGICKEQGLICTYNIQGTFIKSGLFDGTLKYIQDTPSIFCVQEIGGLTKNQTDFIKMIKGGYNLRDRTIRQAQIAYAPNVEIKKPGSGFFGNSEFVKSIPKGAMFKQDNWTCIQYYWQGKNGGPKDTAILYNTESYKFIKILSIPFIGAGKQYRPIGGVLLHSKNLERQIAVFTIHMPSLGGGVIPDIYESIIAYLNANRGVDIFLVGDFNLDSDTVGKEREEREEREESRKGFLNDLLRLTGSRLYASPIPTHQSGRKLDYIIHRPARGGAARGGVGLPINQDILRTLLSHNVAGSDHSSLGLCLEDIFPAEVDFEEIAGAGAGAVESEVDFG